MKKKNYFLKQAVTIVIALLSVYSVNAQLKVPTFTELTNIVNDGDRFTFLYETGAAWGDYNNDGYLDLLTIGAGNSGLTAVLYKNNGGLNFTTVEHPFAPLRAASVTWLDYDNDGNLDVFITGFGAGDMRFSGLYHNLGPDQNYEFEEVFPGEFAYIDNEGGNRPNRYVAVGDYNNDGWVDIYMQGMEDVEDGTQRRSYLYKNVEGVMFTPVTFPVNNETKPLVQMNGGSAIWYDYNGDGFLDLIAIGWAINSDAYYGYDFGYKAGPQGLIYKNNGDGTFDEPFLFPAGQSDATAIDYNNDGYEDFVVAGYCWSQDGYWSGVDWQGDLQINDGNGAFERQAKEITGLAGVQNHSVATGDLNNDGYEDVLYLAGESGGIPDAFFLNNLANKGETDPIFTKVDFSYNFAQRGGTACLADYDNDNDLDAFLIAYSDGDNQFPRFMRNDLGEGIPANLAPSAPTNLQATTAGDVTTFTWTASTDDFTPQAALRYNLYVKQGDVIKSVLPADLTPGRLKVNEALAPIVGTTYQLFDLEGEYEWGVQAIDNAKNTSTFTKVGGTAIAKINPVSVIVTGEKQAIKVRANGNLNGTVNVYTVSGAKVYAKAGQINNISVEVPAGVYIVKTTSNRGNAVNKVIVK
jgi:hypothetical protein